MIVRNECKRTLATQNIQESSMNKKKKQNENVSNVAENGAICRIICTTHARSGHYLIMATRSGRRHRPASHGNQLGALFVLFLEKRLFNLHRDFGAERIDIVGPQAGTRVQENQPAGNAHGKYPWRPVRKPGRGDYVALVISRSLPGLTCDAVQDPDQNSAQQSAVKQVDGKTLLAQPK